jgi:hypothetical protein
MTSQAPITKNHSLGSLRPARRPILQSKSSVGTNLVVEYCHVRSKVPSVDRDVEWPYLGEGLVSHNSAASRRVACPSRERVDGL